jgi:DNA processing protein
VEKEKELLYLLALQRVKGIGTINAKKLITHLGTAEAVFRAKKTHLKSISGIGDFTIQFLDNPHVLAIAEKEVNYVLRNQIRFSTFTDSTYPEKLKACADGPLLLFEDGHIHYDHQPIISIVGTRNMSGYGKEFIEKLLEEVKAFQPIIVSGFAYGVDITAHKAAMHHGLQTIAVLAHGLDEIYPKTHYKYVSKILENGGLYTEHWHDEQPLRENFLQRNRIVAGLSDATIIVESAAKGGSLVTAEIANSYNREVFAVPGRITDPYSQGCNNLIRTNRAQLLNSASDLIYYLNWDQPKKQTKIIQPQLFVNLEGEEKIIYEYLQQNGKNTLDLLSLETKIPIFKLSGTLLNLELKGLVRPLPGKVFESV